MIYTSQVIDIGDHDYCVVHTASQTQWLNKNWDILKKQGQLDSAFKNLLRFVRNGNIAVKILNALNIADYVKVRVNLAQAARFNYCFVYAIDGVGKIRWRDTKLRPVKDKNHVNIIGIKPHKPNNFVYVETKLKDHKYMVVFGYP